MRGVHPELEARLRRIEPEAPLVRTMHAEVAPELLFPPDPDGLRAQRRAGAAAKSAGVRPKGLVVINPGNPTGQVMSGDEIRGAIELAKEENLVIMADEVYQTNIYGANSKFLSFFKVLKQLEAEDAAFKSVELVSYHSISKGIFGECGLRFVIGELGLNPMLIVIRTGAAMRTSPTSRRAATSSCTSWSR